MAHRRLDALADAALDREGQGPRRRRLARPGAPLRVRRVTGMGGSSRSTESRLLAERCGSGKRGATASGRRRITKAIAPAIHVRSGHRTYAGSDVILTAPLNGYKADHGPIAGLGTMASVRSRRDGAGLSAGRMTNDAEFNGVIAREKCCRAPGMPDAPASAEGNGASGPDRPRSERTPDCRCAGAAIPARPNAYVAGTVSRDRIANWSQLRSQIVRSLIKSAFCLITVLRIH